MNEMEKVFLTFSFFTVCSALFFPFFNFQNGQQSMMNICIYSVDPAQYVPKCFMCPSTAYANVLQTCLQASTIPSNVSYTQARCLEQNCMIRRGRRSVDEEASGRGDNSASSEWSLLNRTLLRLHQLHPSEEAAANYDSDERMVGLSIVGEEEAIAVPEEDLDSEYEDEEDLGEML